MIKFLTLILICFQVAAARYFDHGDDSTGDQSPPPQVSWLKTCVEMLFRMIKFDTRDATSMIAP